MGLLVPGSREGGKVGPSYDFCMGGSYAAHAGNRLRPIKGRCKGGGSGVVQGKVEGRSPLIRCDGIDSRAWLWYVEGLIVNWRYLCMLYRYSPRSVPSLNQAKVLTMYGKRLRWSMVTKPGFLNCAPSFDLYSLFFHPSIFFLALYFLQLKGEVVRRRDSTAC